MPNAQKKNKEASRNLSKSDNVKAGGKKKKTTHKKEKNKEKVAEQKKINHIREQQNNISEQQHKKYLANLTEIEQERMNNGMCIMCGEEESYYLGSCHACGRGCK